MYFSVPHEHGGPALQIQPEGVLDEGRGPARGPARQALHHGPHRGGEGHHARPQGEEGGPQSSPLERSHY
ncbi:MAG: hypothetical protein ACK56I_05145 [bacterium]